MTQQQGKDTSPEAMAAEIERLAHADNFAEAEQLREQLLADHPMALAQIISTGELIEELKAKNVDTSHLERWQELYGDLSQEEINCLYYSGKGATVAGGKLLLSQGKINNRLFFIESGQVTLFHVKGEDRHLVGQLRGGDILGEESFLDISNSTFSAGCQSEVKLRYLEKATVMGWEKKFPGLKNKLSEFCQAHGKSREILLARKIEKRGFARLPVEGRVNAHVLKPDGTRTGHHFRGMLQDISRSGMNFDIRCSKNETAQALLGRLLDVEFEQDGTPISADKFVGRVVRVGFQLHAEYSVHLRFEKEVSEEDISGLTG